MVTANVKVLLCDGCGKSEPDVQVRRLVIFPPDGGQRGQRQLRFDVCADCRATKPLTEWEALQGKQKTTGRVVRPRAVVSEDEVQAAAKKSPARRRTMKASR